MEKLCSIEDKYWNYDPFKMNEHELDETLLCLTREIKDSIRDIYIDIKSRIPMTNNANPNIVSDTLITKVMMGTLGCVPAFDERLKKGLKVKGLQQTYTKQNISKIIEMIKNNKFEKELYDFCEEHKVYTPMRVIDMYFWGIAE